MTMSGTGRNFSALAAGAVFCCATAFAQHAATMGAQNQGLDSMSNNHGASAADMDFVKKALLGSMAEVQLGQLALQKSSNDQVKQFAQRMIDDHTKMIDDMKPIAQQVGLKIPNGPSKKDKAEMARLQALSGYDFDQAYVKDMVKDHKEDDSDFKTEISSGHSQIVKDAASKGDPVIESHLQQIEGIAQSMNLAGM